MSKKKKALKLTKAEVVRYALFLGEVAKQAKSYYDSISAGQFHGLKCPACGREAMLQADKNYDRFTDQQYIFTINLRCTCGKGWLYKFTEMFDDQRRIIARK